MNGISFPLFFFVFRLLSVIVIDELHRVYRAINNNRKDETIIECHPLFGRF